MASLNSLLMRSLLFKWSIKTNKFAYQERFLFGISTFWIFKMEFEGFLILNWELFKAHFVLKGSCSQSTLLFLSSLTFLVQAFFGPFFFCCVSLSSWFPWSSPLLYSLLSKSALYSQVFRLLLVLWQKTLYHPMLGAVETSRDFMIAGHYHTCCY